MPSRHVSRPSANYDAFDTIAEPGRRPQPMFMRRTKARRSRAAVLGATFCAILLVWGWRSSGIDITPSLSRLTNTNLTSSFMPSIHTPEISETTEMPSLHPPVDESAIKESQTHHSTHLLIPASESNPEFCKTILSAFVIGYPAPTLINWGQETKDSAVIKEAASHTAKIKGVYNYLNDKSKVKDDDLVMVVDGYDVWFQLPMQILIQRYHELLEEMNQRSKSRYGMISRDENGDDVAERVLKYPQKVIFSADKICWPNPKVDPACVAVPYSTLPPDVYGPGTDNDREAFLNRPRYLNSGNIIGPVKEVREVYKAALEKVEKIGGDFGDQYVFAEVFGEQEFQRETARQNSQNAGASWLEWIADTLRPSDSPLSANVTIKNLTAVPGRRYEYGIGLDYESRLFQTMTHSAEDVAFIYYNSSSSDELLSTSHHHSSQPLFLPKDLQSANPPLTYASPGNRTNESDPKRKTLLLPYSAKFDDLPDQNVGGSDPSWRNMPLATNTYAATIPGLLHINGDKSLLKTWWPKMWFHPYSRALLRRFIRSTQTVEANEAAAKGGKGWWDMRGGRGGIWTDKATWMNWNEVCKGYEDEVFGDGKGIFAEEEGKQRKVNSFGKVLVGDLLPGETNE